MSDRGVVHVDLDRLDRLLNLVGELVINRTSFVEQGRRARARYGFKEQVLSLLENTERVGRLSEEIQSRIIQARLVPVDTVFGRFTGLVKELSETTDKKIRLQVVGGKTEVDKRTIDELAEPLVHLVRNALDHGIETVKVREHAGKPATGTVVLQAHHEGNRLVVSVRDDGAGIDPVVVRRRAVERGVVTAEVAEALSDEDTLQLVFRPGFSTRTGVTGMSGRGVGMDAAQRRVQMLGGVLQLSSTPGEGTEARIELPLTTAIVEALMVGVEGEVYALPLEHVREIVRVEPSQISTVEGTEVVEVRGQGLSLVHLAELADLPRERRPVGAMQVVVVQCGTREVALSVDATLQRHEIVIKGMGRRLAGVRGIAGASISGDGNVVMVLDVAALVAAAPRVRGRSS